MIGLVLMCYQVIPHRCLHLSDSVVNLSAEMFTQPFLPQFVVWRKVFDTYIV